MDWFRYYHDTVEDKKIKIIARETGLEFLYIYGAWSAILCLGSASPVRGSLMVTTSQPLTDCDVSETFHVTLHETNLLLHAFAEKDMLTLEEGGVWRITNWEKRQFESDSSTDRVRKCREKKRFCNVSVTPQKQIQIQNLNTPPTPSLKDDNPARRAEAHFSPYHKVTKHYKTTLPIGNMSKLDTLTLWFDDNFDGHISPEEAIKIIDEIRAAGILECPPWELLSRHAELKNGKKDEKQEVRFDGSRYPEDPNDELI